MIAKPAAASRMGATRWVALARATFVATSMMAIASPPPPALAATAAAENVVEIAIDNFSFSPAEVTVSPGTTVKWTNRDDIPDTVAEKGLSFRSKAMDTDETYSMTFTTAGVVDYFCTLHPHMTGRVVVR